MPRTETLVLNQITLTIWCKFSENNIMSRWMKQGEPYLEETLKRDDLRVLIFFPISYMLDSTL